MRTSTSRSQDSIEFKLEQTLSGINLKSLAGDEANCQICKETLNEGDQITLYLYRPADRGSYAVGQCRCSDHNEDLTPLFTLGVNELIIDGRIGHCSNHTSQQSSPVLLAPRLCLVSAAATTTGRKITTDQSNRNESAEPLIVNHSQSIKTLYQQITTTIDDSAGWQESSPQATSNIPPTVTASLQAVLDGQLLPTNTPVTCQACGDTLQEGSQIIVEQTTPQHISWQPTAWYCPDCQLKTSTPPRPPVYRVFATVGMRSFSALQQHQPCLNDPVVVSTGAVTDTTDCSPEITPSVCKAGIDPHTQCHAKDSHPNNSTTLTANPTND